MSQNPISVHVKNYSGNVTFKDFDYQDLSMQLSQRTKTFEDMINQSFKLLHDTKKIFDKRHEKMEKKL